MQIYGAGQWLEEKHGTKSRWGWRKLHMVLDANSGDTIAHVMTDQDAGDALQVEPLVDQINMAIMQFTADGAVRPMTPSRGTAQKRRWSFLPRQCAGTAGQ